MLVCGEFSHRTSDLQHFASAPKRLFLSCKLSQPQSMIFSVQVVQQPGDGQQKVPSSRNKVVITFNSGEKPSACSHKDHGPLRSKECSKNRGSLIEVNYRFSFSLLLQAHSTFIFRKFTKLLEQKIVLSYLTIVHTDSTGSIYQSGMWRDLRLPDGR